MTDKEFTASNGWTVSPNDLGKDTQIYNQDGNLMDYVMSEGMDSLREYFQAERDKELGRWRDPENPDYVVYPALALKRQNILNEKTGTVLYTQDSDAGYKSDWLEFIVLRNYLKANPAGCKANTTVLGSCLICAGEAEHEGVHYFEDADSGALITWDGPDAV